jgi:type I restriction enzyme S subunit
MRSLPPKWREIGFDEAFERLKLKSFEIPSKDYQVAGRYPIIDQGDGVIAGYIDREGPISSIPFIVFGDHTTIVKYVDKPCFIGSQGVVPLKAKECYDPYFLYLMLGRTRIPALGYSRHFRELENKTFPLPPLAEQRKIAEILRTWDEAIETAEAELKAKQERKRVLMQGLFSKKDCGESFEGRYITEIAELSKDRPWGNETVCVDLEHVSPLAGQLIGSLPVNGDEVSKLRFRKDDVLFAKLRPYLKKAWLTDREGICSSEFWVFRAKQDLGDPGFLRQFVLSEPFLEACAASSGSKMPRADWAHVEKIKFMLPSLNEQRVTAGILQAADAEIDAINDFIKLLSTQKRGLMQKLLTGEVRVAV